MTKLLKTNYHMSEIPKLPTNVSLTMVEYQRFLTCVKPNTRLPQQMVVVAAVTDVQINKNSSAASASFTIKGNLLIMN